jgi:hypothetical protein
MELESIMLSEISQTQKAKYHVFSHLLDLKKIKKMKIKVELLGTRKGIMGGGIRECTWSEYN